jgi:ketosteroid isomerase-like protein
MSEENVNIIRRGAALLDARELSAFYELFHANVVYRNRADEPEVRVYQGLEEFQGYITSWLDMFEDLRIEVLECIDLGEQVISVEALHSKGGASGAEVRGVYVYVWTFRDGLIVDGREYATKQEALEAAGLPE